MNVRPLVISPSPGKPAGAKTSAMVFVWDRDSEGVVRQSLGDLGLSDVEFTTGGIEAATKVLGERPSPRLLVADITGVKDPLTHVNALAEVCEPGIGVVVIGQENDIRLYRALKETGVAEYFFKPLVSNLLTRTFNGILTGGREQRGSRTGKLVFVLGARGGDGATTLAVNTAWHLTKVGQRRVLLLDLDLQFGDAALQLDATPSHALREALEHPERVDDLFLQRGAAQVTERLSLLAAQEPLNEAVALADAPVLELLGNLLHRYRYVVVDVPIARAPELMRVLTLPSVLLLVSSPSLASIRDTIRWRQQIGPNTPERQTFHILNKAGSQRGLSLDEVVRALGQAPDFVVPFEREIALASNLGISAVAKCAGFQRNLAPLYRRLTGEKVAEPTSLFKRLFR